MRYNLSELTENNVFWLDAFQFNTNTIIAMSTILAIFSTDWRLGALGFLCNYFIAVSIYKMVNVISKYIGYWKVVISNNKVTLHRGLKKRIVIADSIEVGGEHYNKAGDKVKVISVMENDTRLIIPILDNENTISNLK